MYIISSFLLSIINYYVGKKEMDNYKNINENLKKYIYIYPILIMIIFLIKGNTYFSIFFGAITPLLISHIIIDLKEQELPNLTNLVIFIFGLLRLILNFINNGFNLDIIPFLSSYLVTGAILFVFYLIIALITGGALGGGDIKLIGALGIFFPNNLLIKLLIYPIILGALIATALLISKKGNKDSKFAFGPAIIMSVCFIAIS